MSAYRQVVQEAVDSGAVRVEDETKVFLAINRAVNMTGGRASDAARSEVAAYKRLGADAWVAAWKQERGL